MRFKFYTLVDITKTDARFNKSDPSWHQQQNYLTFLQTLALRVNVEIENLTAHAIEIKGLGFGSSYKEIQNVWSGEFNVEYEGGLTVEMLNNDFHLVPIINGLDETIKLKDCVFDTKNKQTKNIVFELNNNS